jgi:MFS transporter, FSR family, fosmidomycin resistance protein
MTRPGELPGVVGIKSPNNDFSTVDVSKESVFWCSTAGNDRAAQGQISSVSRPLHRLQSFCNAALQNKGLPALERPQVRQNVTSITGRRWPGRATTPVTIALMTHALPSSSRAADIKTIGLVGLAHGTSHFFHMLLPPLFAVFAAEFHLSFAALGMLVTVFFAISGVGQALAGFLVDRVGARPVLYAALLCFAGAALAASQAQGWAGLMAAAALAGLGNAPFHPVDFTILNHRVHASRLGHAFAAHGISGNLGWAVAPVFLLGLTHASGSWRVAYFGAAVLALGVLGLIVWQWRLLDDRGGAAGAPAARVAAASTGLAFLRLPAVWMCFGFFLATTVALSAVQSFSGPALGQLHSVAASSLAYVVTGYMMAGAAGMVLGGFLAARARARLQLEPTIAACLMASAALLALAAWPALPLVLALLCVIAAGLGAGMAGPSRDMMIKQAAPPGATGRVYGAVYSGLDIGFALGAPLFGALLDQGRPSAVFLWASLALALAVACTGLLRSQRRAEPAVAPGASA